MEHWKNYWSSTRYEPVIATPPPSLYGGTNTEPLASIGMSCFLDAVRDDFKEGFRILDYGCGAGILGNFISSRLQDFTYYGLEPSTNHGRERIELANQHLADSRLTFGLIDEDFKSITQEKLDSVILISIFTHMLAQDIESVLNSLQIVLDTNPKANIIFSCFLDSVARVENPEPHIWERFYGKSFITLQFLEEYCSSKNLKLVHHMDFIAQGDHKHSIIKISKV